MSLSEDQIEILRENCDNKLTEKSDDEIRQIQEESILPPSLFMTYYLREEGIKLKNIAGILGLGDKSAVGKYLNRIKDKKRTFEQTEKAFSLSEKTDKQKRKAREEYAKTLLKSKIGESGVPDDWSDYLKDVRDEVNEKFSVKLGLRTIEKYTKEVREDYE